MTSYLLKSFSRYPTYFIVGSFCAFCTIALRAAIGILIGERESFGYIVSILIAYMFGIALSYVLNKRFTFKDSASRDIHSERILFIGTSVLGMLVTMGISLFLRDMLTMIFLPWRSTLAFALAAFISSALTYLISKVIVFKV